MSSTQNVTTSVYNARGQLVSLTDWDEHPTRFAYDLAGRHIATTRTNGLRSRYVYDAGGRLRTLKHDRGSRTLARFDYEVDGRGNRTQATEFLLHPPTTDDVTLAYDDPTITYKGTWSDDDPFMASDSISARLSVIVAGDEISFTYGVGPDHSIFDVYIGKTLWQSYDGYAASDSEVTETIHLNGNGPHRFEFRNRPEKNLASSGFTVRFKQLVSVDIGYDLHTIQYQYDLLSRLLTADYYPGDNVASAPFRSWQYEYDLVGNRTQQIRTVGGTPTTHTYGYNAANQMTSWAAALTYSYQYDPNGNLTTRKQGGITTEVYTWDRANRLLGGVSSTYAYDGLGNRIRYTIGPATWHFLLDVQPELGD